MAKKFKVVFIPLVASICFMLTYWITNVREINTVFGMSSDLAGGTITGIGIGLMLVLVWSLRKGKSTQ